LGLFLQPILKAVTAHTNPVSRKADTRADGITRINRENNFVLQLGTSLNAISN
jgi:hypothetical protein